MNRTAGSSRGRARLLRRRGEWRQLNPTDTGWHFLSHSLERLPVSERPEQRPEGDETSDPLFWGGIAAVDSERCELEPRTCIGDSLRRTVCAQRGVRLSAEAADDLAEVAVARAPCKPQLEPVLQRPNDTDGKVRGSGSTKRQGTNLCLPPGDHHSMAASALATLAWARNAGEGMARAPYVPLVVAKDRA